MRTFPTVVLLLAALVSAAPVEPRADARALLSTVDDINDKLSQVTALTTQLQEQINQLAVSGRWSAADQGISSSLRGRDVEEKEE